MLKNLFEIIEDRKINPAENSYTNALFNAGYTQIAQKVGEEAVEVIIAAGSQGKTRLIEEASDLIYHLFVLLANQDITLADIEAELEKRHSIKS